MNVYIVRYKGEFAFIKPWSAVRDSLTYSQQFLTPSIIMGIERKLFPELLSSDAIIHKIKGHRLSYAAVSVQQEQVQPRGWNKNKNNLLRSYAILQRGVFVRPSLLLAFSNKEDALVATQQHICLCRNEDILFPEAEIVETDFDNFNTDSSFYGYELLFERGENEIMIGYNRYRDFEPMYGTLKIVGNPITDYLDPNL